MRLEARLLHVRRPVTRQVRVPGRLTLRQLHRLLQALFGLTDCDLYKFTVGDEVYGNLDLVDYDWVEDYQDDGGIRLRDLPPRRVRFRYHSDFGLGWVVELRVLSRDDEGPVECLQGAGPVPPQECGGPPALKAFDRDALNRRLARMFPGGRPRPAPIVRTPRPWAPSQGPAPLEAYHLDRLNLRHQMFAALVERGGPMTLADLQERLQRAGTVPPKGELSLRKAWRKQGPIRERVDGRLEVDSEHPEHWRFELHLRNALPKEEPPAPAPPPAPALPEGPLRREELEAPAGRGIRWPYTLSTRRRLALGVLARGGRAALEEVLQDLQGYGEPLGGDLKKSFTGTPTALRLTEGQVELDPDCAEARAAIQTFRKWWAPLALHFAAEERRPARAEAWKEEQAREREATRRWFAGATRALVHVAWHGSDVAGWLLELPSGRLRPFTPEALQETEILVGLDPKGVFERLDLDPAGHRFVDLRPPFRRAGGRPVSVAEAIRMTIPVPLASPESLEHLWETAGVDSVRERLRTDLPILHALYRYGVIHGYVRRGPEDTEEVAWNLGAEPVLWDALRAKQPLQIAVAPADPRRPEESLRPFAPDDAGWGVLVGTWLDTGEWDRLQIPDVVAFRN